MLTVDNIRNYWRFGGARPVSSYISDDELKDILCHELPDKYAPYTLISDIWENMGDYFLVHHKEHHIDEFKNLRNAGVDTLYLRSIILTPELNIAASPLTSSLSQDYTYYYVYKGLLTIRCGTPNSYNKIDETDISIIEKYVFVGTPEERNIYLNKEYLEAYYNTEYLEIFKRVKKCIKKRLMYRTVSKNDGQPAKYPNVSEGFAKAMREGTIDTGRMEII